MKFHQIIKSEIPLAKVPCRNLAEMIFRKLDHRNEDCDVILSHDNTNLLKISLPQFRSILLNLYIAFRNKGINIGDTILVVSMSGNNECYLSILFAALSSFGVRVFLPMFVESSELDSWLEITNSRGIIFPEQEISLLNHHEKEKKLVKEIRASAKRQKIPLFDTFADFKIHELISETDHLINPNMSQLAGEIMHLTDLDTDALIITTSGSSGKSQLVYYNQGAFIRNCVSWQCAGFFKKEILGGRGFTPLFTHTIGIRIFFNAIWCGSPVCLINTDWFIEKPERVRYLLMQMKPENLTGGPAIFKLLLELMRTFPELKSELKPYLKTIISTGAQINPEVVSDIESTFNIHVNNAFGTTETQQVLNTLLIRSDEQMGNTSMGAPLPGVKIALEKFDVDHLYRLYVKSPFGCKCILSEGRLKKGSAGYFRTGDIVRFENKKLIYAGRESSDFFKDGFGVKIPIATVRDYYKKVALDCDHLEFFPISSEPGLAVLIFTGSPREISYYTNILEQTNDELFRCIDPFAYRHYTIRRFALVDEAAPCTAKGNISHHQINLKNVELIADLVSVFPRRDIIRKLKYKVDSLDPFTLHLNPYIGNMLHELRMDYIYHRSYKDSLFTFKEQKELEILDMTGGFGTNLLGHNHKELTEAVIDFIQTGKVSLSNQGSIQNHSGMLADKLNGVVGNITNRQYHVCLGSTGAEITEMALHHACFQWRRQLEKIHVQQSQLYGNEASDMIRQTWEKNQEKIKNTRLFVIVSNDCFHGHTSAARSLLARSEKRDSFSNILPISPIYIDDRKPDWKSDLLDDEQTAFLDLQRVVYRNKEYAIESFRVNTIIASLFEPIHGEGGIRSLDPDFLRYFSEREYPLILDEIQCGLGRSGSFLASEGIHAKYYLFAKALGGGIEKIGALLIESSCYQSNFDKFYSSTFANGELAATVALKVLEIVHKDNISGKAWCAGNKIRHKLEEIRLEFPDVIKAITGRGLMQGLCFNDNIMSDTIVPRLLFQNKMLGYLFASYLLYYHNIRILPSLVASNVLRIEPSAYISDNEIDRFILAIKDLVHLIHHKKYYQLFKHLMEEDRFPEPVRREMKINHFYQYLDKPAPGSVQVTFICHFAYPVDELRAFEKDFQHASDTGLRILFKRMQKLLEMNPVTIFQKNIVNQRIHFTCMAIPLDSAELERMHRGGNRREVVNKIQKAVDMAALNGSRVISLGGYTSILSNSGLALTSPKNVKVITGNTLTVASGLKRLFEALKKREWYYRRGVIAVVGSPGNIGSILATRLIQRPDLFSEVILVGRSINQLNQFYEYLEKEKIIPDGLSVKRETDLRSLIQCDVIVNSTNTNDPIIFPHHIKKDGKVLIVDNSVPSGLSSEVTRMNNVINLPFASYVELPFDPDFVISTYTPPGTAFCCAAEAILCGLEEISIPLIGKISSEAVDKITALAEKHRFFPRMGGIVSYKSKKNEIPV